MSFRAAHLHPPAGGYGSNAGIQDAHNLAWKITAVLEGWAGAGLLATYEQERRPVASATAVDSLLMDGVPAERLGGARRCDPRILVAGYRYDSAAVVGAEPLPGGGFPATFELSGAPGTRLPHIWLRSRHGARISAPDLCGTAFTVLGADASWPGAAAKAASELGVPLRAYHLGYGGDLAGGHGAVASELGIGTHGAILVRPDGFVAWRSPLTPPQAVHERSDMLVLVPRQVLCRPDPAASPRSAKSDHEAGHTSKGGQATGARPA